MQSHLLCPNEMKQNSKIEKIMDGELSKMLGKGNTLIELRHKTR